MTVNGDSQRKVGMTGGDMDLRWDSVPHGARPVILIHVLHKQIAGIDALPVAWAEIGTLWLRSVLSSESETCRALIRFHRFRVDQSRWEGIWRCVADPQLEDNGHMETEEVEARLRSAATSHVEFLHSAARVRVDAELAD